MDSREVRLSIRVPEHEMALWKEAAWRRRMSLSSWCRLMLGQAAEQTVEKVAEPKS